MREDFAKAHQDDYARLDNMADEKKLLNKEWDKMWKERPKQHTKEYKIWSKEYEELIKKTDINIRGKEAIRDAIKKDLRERLIINKKGFEIDKLIDDNFKLKEFKKIRSSVDDLSKMVKKELWPKEVRIRFRRIPMDGRAFQDGGTVNITNVESKKVIVHEMGHFLEGNSKGMHKKIRAFYRMRTEGELAKHLGRGYRPDEMFKKDKFIDNYMGKIYRDATEVLSMGLEYMESNPMKLMEKDPGMFDFILDIIRGIK